MEWLLIPLSELYNLAASNQTESFLSVVLGILISVCCKCVTVDWSQWVLLWPCLSPERVSWCLHPATCLSSPFTSDKVKMAASHPSLQCQAQHHDILSGPDYATSEPICPRVMPLASHWWPHVTDGTWGSLCWHVHWWSQRGDAQSAPMRLIAEHMA